MSAWSDPPIVNSTLSREEGVGDIRQSPLARQIAPAIRAVQAGLLVGVQEAPRMGWSVDRRPSVRGVLERCGSDGDQYRLLLSLNVGFRGTPCDRAGDRQHCDVENVRRKRRRGPSVVGSETIATHLRLALS